MVVLQGAEGRGISLQHVLYVSVPLLLYAVVLNSISPKETVEIKLTTENSRLFFFPTKISTGFNGDKGCIIFFCISCILEKVLSLY